MQQSSLFLKEQINRSDIRILFENIQDIRKNTDQVKKHFSSQNQDAINLVASMEKSLEEISKLLTLQKHQDNSLKEIFNLLIIKKNHEKPKTNSKNHFTM